MIVAFTLFILSFLVMATMVAIQMHKLNTGKTFALFRFGERMDHVLREKYLLVRQWILLFNRRTLSLLFHFVLDKIEGVFIKLKDRGHSKVSGLLEKVQAKEGKVLPSAKEKVSTFISKLKK